MTDDAREEKTLHHAVEGQDSAPREGLEREDAQSSEVLVPREELSATQLGSTSGMWSRGSGDTSGYGGIVRELEFPPLAQRPFGGYFDAVADRMLAVVPDVDLSHVIIHRDQITFTIRREQLLDVMRQLRDDAQLRFEGLMSVSGVHYPHHAGAELHVVYQLLSYTHNRRITLEVTCPDADPHIPSVVSVYPMADYHERETWDMFGVIFDGHPSLTRILMPDDWQGHPQRKDYPLGGIPVEFKGAVVPPPSDRRKY